MSSIIWTTWNFIQLCAEFLQILSRSRWFLKNNVTFASLPSDFLRFSEIQIPTKTDVILKTFSPICHEMRLQICKQRRKTFQFNSKIQFGPGSLLFHFTVCLPPLARNPAISKSQQGNFHNCVERGDNTMEYMWLLYKHDMIEVPHFIPQAQSRVKAGSCSAPLQRTVSRWYIEKEELYDKKSGEGGTINQGSFGTLDTTLQRKIQRLIFNFQSSNAFEPCGYGKSAADVTRGARPFH